MIYVLCIIGGIVIGVLLVGALLIAGLNYAVMKGLGW